MKIVIVHHSADSDGLMSEAVCRHFIDCPELLPSIGWDYGQPIPELPECDRIFMVDVSIDTLLADEAIRRKTVLIDHHRTCRDKWLPFAESFAGFHVYEGVAACRLCWWFFSDMLPAQNGSTLVTPYALEPAPGEPLVVFLIGLRDVWRHVGTSDEADAKHLEMGLRSVWPAPMAKLLNEQTGNLVGLDELIDRGELIFNFAEKESVANAERGAHLLLWEGYRFLCLNTQGRGSMTLDTFSKEHRDTMPHEALLVWAVDKSGSVNLSLYHTADKKHFDLSIVAKKYGGGGHPGACGLRMPLAQWVEIISREAEVLG